VSTPFYITLDLDVFMTSLLQLDDILLNGGGEAGGKAIVQGEGIGGNGKTSHRENSLH